MHGGNLVDDTTSKNTVDEVDIFTPGLTETEWACPFCLPTNTFKLTIPSQVYSDELSQVKLKLKAHLQAHKTDILNRLTPEEAEKYEKTKDMNAKAVRLWINGTIKDRGLYRSAISNQNSK